MTEQEKQYDIHDLYKALRKQDVEILKHFCDKNLSDTDYFLYGIKSDIFSNTLNVIINYLSGNIESAGVDNSCRIIIEALVIFVMDAKGKISEKQKTIYRYLYAFVDFDNFHSLMTSEVYENEKVKLVLKDKEKAEKAMLEHFNCSVKDLKKREISIDDPCFYLKTNLNDDIRFVKLLEEYPVGNEDTIKMYEFFSLFIHPRCEINPKIEEGIMGIRNHYIENILDIVFHYLNENNLLSFDKNVPDFNAEFFYNPLLTNNVHNISDMEFMFHLLMSEVCYLKDGMDWFTWFFLEKSKYLIIDMMISLSLGYKEHVISNFKPFVEQYAIFYAVGKTEDLKDFECIKRAFCYSSRIQLEPHLQKLGIDKNMNLEEEIQKLYTDYFKRKYNLNNYNKFYWNFKRNSLYFLSNEKKSYNKYVRTLIESIFTNEILSKDIVTLYRISKDMSHASGYNFNASEGVVDVSCHKALIAVCEMMNHFILYASLTLEEHGMKCDAKSKIDFFNLMINIQQEELKKVYDYNNSN